ncbi:MAG TPA: hypothetical protein PKU93_02385 [Candidatus Pacearchaeota archaeon]|nr:hypothetical protein [Candidatus Pacearchaeota archaeon]
MVEPIEVGIGINLGQLILLFILTFFAAITAAVIIAVFLVGYLVYLAYLYSYYVKSGPLYAAIQATIMSVLVIITAGVLIGPNAMMIIGTMFVVPIVVVFIFAQYVLSKTKPEPPTTVDLEGSKSEDKDDSQPC